MRPSEHQYILVDIGDLPDEVRKDGLRSEDTPVPCHEYEEPRGYKFLEGPTASEPPTSSKL